MKIFTSKIKFLTLFSNIYVIPAEWIDIKLIEKVFKINWKFKNVKLKRKTFSRKILHLLTADFYSPKTCSYGWPRNSKPKAIDIWLCLTTRRIVLATKGFLKSRVTTLLPSVFAWNLIKIVVSIVGSHTFYITVKYRCTYNVH